MQYVWLEMSFPELLLKFLEHVTQLSAILLEHTESCQVSPDSSEVKGLCVCVLD